MSTGFFNILQKKREEYAHEERNNKAQRNHLYPLRFDLPRQAPWWINNFKSKIFFHFRHPAYQILLFNEIPDLIP